MSAPEQKAMIAARSKPHIAESTPFALDQYPEYPRVCAGGLYAYREPPGPPANDCTHVELNVAV
jgi:hypothetical protein